MKWSVSRVAQGLRRRSLQARNNARIARLAAQVEQHAPSATDARPLIFFNASSRLAWMSQNAAFSLLSGWGARLSGAPVIHFVCRAGMLNCQLGVNKDAPLSPPPCAVCVRQSQHLYAGAAVAWMEPRQYPELEAALQPLTLAELSAFTWQGLPLGALVLPSLCWALRCHTLPEEDATLYLLRQFIQSAWNVAEQFEALIKHENPRGVVVFNGIAFPEAVVRHIAQAHGLWVVTHEVGLQPLTGYFTRGQATAYPIDIPAGYRLSAQQEERLNGYLEKRMRGHFTMAGVQFWPEMRSLDQDLLTKMAQYDQTVAVFTNVIFDTSQVHANVLFRDMFAWLDDVLALVKSHSRTLFVLRAHPDEDRPGKQARDSVAAWAKKNQIENLPNVVFIPPRETFSSYELIQRAKFVMVYNSTIGLEAAIMGAAVLCAGKARFTQLPTVFFPADLSQYRQMAAEFLSAESVAPLPEFQANARLFLYYQLYRTSLPFGDFLEGDLTPGFVLLKPEITWRDFLPENNATLRVIRDGLLAGGDFLLPEGD